VNQVVTFGQLTIKSTQTGRPFIKYLSTSLLIGI